MKCEFYAKEAEEYFYDDSDRELWEIDIMKDRYKHDIQELKFMVDRVNSIKGLVDYKYSYMFRTKFKLKGWKLYKTVDEIDRGILKGIKSVELDGSKSNIAELSYDADNDVMKCYIDAVKFEVLMDADEKEKIISKAKEDFLEKADRLIEKINILIDTEVNRRRGNSLFSKSKWI